VPQHFIRMLTAPGDLVLDIFAGSNTTGQVAEIEGRRWLAFESSREYVAASAFRFLDKSTGANEVRGLFTRVSGGCTVHLSTDGGQQKLWAAE
jgi:site-specific DNA-methyltransferase (cytosine-N4-specific)